MPSRLELYCNGYQPINDPSKQSVDWSKVPTTGSNVVKPYYIPPASVKSDDDTFIISFRDYNDMLTKIYFLEEQVKFLQIQNSKLANNKTCCKVRALRSKRKVR